MSLYIKYSDRLRSRILSLISHIKQAHYSQVRFGHNVLIYPSAIIDIRHKNCNLELGDNVILGCNNHSYSVVKPTKARIVTRLDNAVLVIGNRTNIFGANICVASRITIGDDCQIACGVNILDYNGHRTYNNPRGTIMDEPKPIEIGNNVWIGVNAIVLKGSKIGDNSIVSAGTVVKGEYPANSIIMGNPATATPISNFNS